MGSILYQEFKVQIHNNNPDTLTLIHTHVHITPADFENARDALDQLQELNSDQEYRKALAQKSTVERDQALTALKDYLDNLKIVAQYALGNDQKLEIILRRPIPHSSENP